MERVRGWLAATIVLAVLAVSVSAGPQKPDKAKDEPRVIWHDPGDISALNLLYGAGGKERAPDVDGKFTFVKEDLTGTTPKFDIEDEHGIRWRVKLGVEAQPETAATRLLWAAGYFVDDDYYVADLRVEGMPQLKRGQDLISGEGAVHGVRLERRSEEGKKVGDWDWFSNPFVGQRELNGLKIMMSLINNWDLKEDNNEIRDKDGRLEYLVSDLGASFGRTGNTSKRLKSAPEVYIQTKFIEKSTPEYVDFVMHSRPIFVAVVDVPYYRERSRIAHIPKHIPRADAKWLGQELSQLSGEQVRDCFRAAGYTAAEVDEYASTIRERIGELNGL